MSELPDQLKELIAQTTRRTRLWRAERRDVEQELSAHFTDGLATGKSAETLVKDFGDPNAAAKLIRRSKKRNRPLPWRIMRNAMRATAGVFALMVIVYLYAAARLYSAEPNVTIDYAAQLTQRAQAVRQEDRAWPHYRSALTELKRTPEEEREINLGESSLDEAYTRTAAFLDRHANQLADLRAASAIEELGYVPRHRISDEDKDLWPGLWRDQQQMLPEEQDLLSQSILGILLPYLQEMRYAAICLEAEAQISLDRGQDSSLTIANIEAMLNIARHARETPTLIAELVAVAVMQYAINTTTGALRDHPDAFTEANLGRLAHMFSAIDTSDMVTRALRAERIFFLDIVQRVYTDDGAGDGRFAGNALEGIQSLAGGAYDDIVITKITAPALTLVAPSRREVSEQNEMLTNFALQRAATPMWKWSPETVDEYFEELLGGYSLASKLSLIYLITPHFDRVIASRHWFLQNRDAALVAIALELQRRRTGDWPQSLEEIPKTILPSIPPDQFTGEPIRYAIVDGVPTLYSVGVDRIDDGGTPARQAGQLKDEAAREWIHASRLNEHERLPTGDWILWRGPVPN